MSTVEVPDQVASALADLKNDLARQELPFSTRGFRAQTLGVPFRSCLLHQLPRTPLVTWTRLLARATHMNKLLQLVGDLALMLAALVNAWRCTLLTSL